MLLSSHGASALGKPLRRPIMTIMSSFEGTSALASDALRSSMQRRQPVSNTSRTDSHLPVQKTWHPNHGIVFGSGPKPSNPRSMSTEAVEIKQDLLLHSMAEDNYVMASREITVMEHQSLLDGGPPASTNLETSAVSISPIPATVVNEDPALNEPPESFGTYSIPKDLFHTAKSAKQGTAGSFWTYALYRGPQSKKPTVHYCKSVATTERVIKTYFMDKKMIGFDIEWAPDFMKSAKKSTPRRALSLVQIASEDRIGLFHIAQYPRREDEKFEDLVAPSLKKIMEDSGVTKVGVAIKADCTRLRKNLGINSRGIFELSHLYKLVKFSESKDTHLINKTLVSLATQVQDHLHLPLFKGEVRGSDWSLGLNMDQIIYAASDPYAAVQLYLTLDAKRKRLDPTPPLPWHAELNRPIRVAEGIEIPTDDEESEAEALTKSAPRKDKISEVDLVKSPDDDPKPTFAERLREFSTRIRSHI